MEENKFSIVEWRIENFTCWRERLHGKCITSPTLLSTSVFRELGNISLLPRGPSGHGSHLEVRSTHIDTDFYGDLSFIGPQGSLLCTQRVKVVADDNDKAVEFPPGPLYEDVVALIKKNEEVHGDRLTLRFRFQNDMHSDHNVMSTTIDVAKVSLKIDPKSIERSDEPKCVFHFEDVLLQVAFNKEEKVEFALDPLVENKSVGFMVETSLSFLSSDGTVVVGREENEHLFVNTTPWTFSDSLTIGSGNTVVLGLKVIKNSMKRRQDYDILDCRGVSVIPNERKSSRWFFPEDPKAVLTKDIVSLNKDREFSDFQLKCETASFPVHRAILSARSPVLKTMLSSDMTSDCMDILDLDPSTLAHFLSFLYTGAVEDLQKENALKLYYAADKYQVPTLKRECADYLRANVSLSNVCDVLSLADKLQDEELVMVSGNFILNNYNEVLKSDEWEKFIQEEPLQGVKFLSIITQRKIDACEDEN